MKKKKKKKKKTKDNESQTISFVICKYDLKTYNRIRFILCGDHNRDFVGIFGTCYHHSIQVHKHNHRDNIVPEENNSSVVDDK